MIAVSTLVQDPRWHDEGWRHDLAVQSATLHALQGQLAGVKGIPKDLEQAHGAIVSASRHLEEVVARLTGMGGQETSDWLALVDLMADASESLFSSVGRLSAGHSRAK